MLYCVMVNKMKIGNIDIENRIVMAPMAGITNVAFRKIIKEFGAGLVVSEMVSDKALCYGNQKTIEMLKVDENEHPMVFKSLVEMLNQWSLQPSLLMRILIVISLISIWDAQ